MSEPTKHRADVEPEASALGARIPRENWDSPTTRALIVWQGAYSLAGLITGIIAMCLGAWLASLQISGNATWNFSFLGLKQELSGATPGVVLFVAGAIIVLATRFSVSAAKDKARAT